MGKTSLIQSKTIFYIKDITVISKFLKSIAASVIIVISLSKETCATPWVWSCVVEGPGTFQFVGNRDMGLAWAGDMYTVWTGWATYITTEIQGNNASQKEMDALLGNIEGQWVLLGKVGIGPSNGGYGGVMILIEPPHASWSDFVFGEINVIGDDAWRVFSHPQYANALNVQYIDKYTELVNVSYEFASYFFNNKSTTSTVSITEPPRNEYGPASVRITGMWNIHTGLSTTSANTSGTGDRYYSFTATMTCERNVSVLSLALQQNLLDFHNISTGVTSSVTRELKWTASGTGQASIWTMTFDTAADKKDGDHILLGNAKVKIINADGAQVPLATPVNISGVSGYYIFELDTTGAVPGLFSSDVNITLTAN